MSKLSIILSLVLLKITKGDLPFPFEKDLYDDHIIFHDATTRNEASDYRLPQNVFPIEYDIYIDLYFDETIGREFSYDGRENIVIQASEPGVTQIVLHANVDSINRVSLVTAAGVSINEAEPYILEPQYHFLKINLDVVLIVGDNYTLSIEYSSTMNEGPMKRGIWRGWYTDDNGVERIYATTHFQPYNARQAFPCWDEPLFKAVFNMHLSRPSRYVGRFSNTVLESVSVLGNGRVRDHFLPTPRMSSYLVTFLVSETFAVTAEDTSFTPPIRIIGRSSTSGLTGVYDHVLDFAVKMTEFFDEYLEIPYSSLHPNLLNDHVASPDWASAGTENWGMVSYRENNMVIGRDTLMSVTHYAATLISHELAHKWFGNLVTCYWWSNTWINEGFASYFGYIGTFEKFPEYEHLDHFNSRYLQTSLSVDASESTQALNHEVNTPAQVTGHFGTISYSKGAAFLRMVSDMITPETFRKACQYFLLANAYEPADPTDLYNAFARAIVEDNSLDYLHFNFTDYYRIWVNEPGYPVLTVNIDYSSMEMLLNQERFFLSASATPTNQIYPIPITYSTSRSNSFYNLKPIFMMTNDRAVLPKPDGVEWVIFNNLQHGHYRVNYDARNWNLITEALLDDLDSIHYLNRAQIVDDVFAFMRSERMSYGQGFTILRFLRYETNYHVWDPAISGYTWLRNRLRHLPEEQAEFDAFVLSYLETVIESVGFEARPNETPTATMTRQVILHFACTLGHTRCVQESRQRFVRFINNNEWVHPGIRRNVFTSGIREGSSTAEFQLLEDLFLESQFANDQLEMLRALGATRDSTLLTRYLELTLRKEVRSHDKLTSFNYALLGNQENAEVVLAFFRNNIGDIRAAYVEDSPARPVHSAMSSLASYLNLSGLSQYEVWLNSTQASSQQFTTTINAINSARTNIAWGTENADIILQAARDSATKVLTSLAMLLIMGLIAMAA